MTSPQLLSGRRIVITGASRGLGLATAQHLAGLGASLALVARDPARLGTARDSLDGGPHDLFSFDVADEDSWLNAADGLAGGGAVHGLVTAAALITPIGPLGSYAITEFRRTIDVNVCGTLLAVKTLLPALTDAGGSVVTFSGGGATAPFVRFDAYAASKAAVVRLTENLSLELSDRGVRLNSVAPGFVVTEMHDATLAAGPDLVGQAYFERTSSAVAEGGGDSPENAAELVAFLLSDHSAGISGKLISARWDPWRDESFCDRLRNEADLATLRRIDDQAFTARPKVNRPPLTCILAGGLGTRLGEITTRIPKPLVEVAGEPFLAHQLRLLARYGLTEVVLCVGHLGEMIEAEFGPAFGETSITYSYDDPGLNGTLGAIRKALPLLGERFLVLYGDTYLRIDYDAAWRAWDLSGLPALMTVLANRGRWDRSNAIYHDGRVLSYDKASPTVEMEWIDYGLGGLTVEVLDKASETTSDLAELYRVLAEERLLFGYEATERFYEIGSPGALAETEAFLRTESGTAG